MVTKFDAGYRRPYSTLVASFPGEDVYPPDSFRTEWGPIFHRGRLDGSARVLVIGQDPATHETICRRILVGEAGQRAQGLLAKLGITRSYVLVNAFLYSVFGQHGGSRHIDDPPITALPQPLARHHRPPQRPAGRHHVRPLRRPRLCSMEGDARRAPRCPAVHASATHPTFPESASASGQLTKAAAMERLCASWNAALASLRPVVTPGRGASTVPLRHERSPRPTSRRSRTRTSRPVSRLDALARRMGRRAPAPTPSRSARRSP